MTYKMTDEYRQILTAMIGEESDGGATCVSNFKIILPNRDFTTDSDMMKVFRWLVVNGKWDKFISFATGKYIIAVQNIHKSHVEMYAWIFYDAERFNVLAAMAKKEGVLK
jgi:hypothetical protein